MTNMALYVSAATSDHIQNTVAGNRDDFTTEGWQDATLSRHIGNQKQVAIRSSDASVTPCHQLLVANRSMRPQQTGAVPSLLIVADAPVIHRQTFAYSSALQSDCTQGTVAERATMRSMRRVKSPKNTCCSDRTGFAIKGPLTSSISNGTPNAGSGVKISLQQNTIITNASSAATLSAKVGLSVRNTPEQYHPIWFE